MKILKGTQTLKGRAVEIPDCGRDDLPEFFKEMGYKVGVEIGVYSGEFTEKFCKAGLKMYAIDPWLPHRDYQRRQSKCNNLYEETKKRLEPYDCEIIRKTSADAVKDFKDESLDFVYIDGNHQIKYIIEDIFEWSFKIKKGGCIAGHDYFYGRPNAGCLGMNHARYAVDAYTACYDIKNYYILGRRKPKTKDEYRDVWRSWFWIKK